MENFLGVRLRTERVKRNLTQAELAELSGSSQRTIWQIENGYVPRKSTLSKIEQAMHLPDGFLLNEVNKQKRKDPEINNEIIMGDIADDPEAIIKINELLDESSLLFAGGEISGDTKEKFMKALMQAYVKCKRNDDRGV